MKKILLPIDGTERSMKSIEFVKNLYSPENVEINIIMVQEDIDKIQSEMEYDEAKKELNPVLSVSANQLLGYNVKKQVVFGRAGEEIINYAVNNDINTIVMTKSTRTGFLSRIGSITNYVVKNAKCIVVILPE